MILLTLALLGTTPSCTDTRQICRACWMVNGKQACSTPGIACQPLRRVCRPNTPSPRREEEARRTRDGKAKGIQAAQR